jgi:hypothetical protein
MNTREAFEAWAVAEAYASWDEEDPTHLHWYEGAGVGAIMYDAFLAGVKHGVS